MIPSEPPLSAEELTPLRMPPRERPLAAQLLFAYATGDLFYTVELRSAVGAVAREGRRASSAAATHAAWILTLMR